MITIGILLIFFHTKKCSAELSFLNRIKKLIGKEIKDKSFKGTFKTLMYLGSEVKISCQGKKSPSNVYRATWYHDDKHFSKNNRYSVDKYGVLTIHNVSVEDSGDFTCASKSKDGVHKYRHNITVLQLPSKSLHVHFMYAVPLCTDENTEFARHFVESKVKGKVCLQDECKLGYIRSECQFQEQFANPTLKVTVPVALPSVPTGSCDVECSREKLKHMKEEVKQKVISAVMIGQRLKIREEPQEMSISHLETEEDDLCKPGFEMKGTRSRSVCVPCSPGHFLEKGYCIPCHLNQYNGKYAAMECQKCFGHRVTRSRGSVSEGDCYVSDPSVLWILLLIVLITIPLILVCLSWSLIRVAGQSLAKGFHSFCSAMKSKTAKGKRKRNYKGNKFRESPDIGSISAGDASRSLPSARHSTAKDYFFKDPRRKVPKNISSPPLPTGPALDQASRRIGQASGDAKLHEKDASDDKKSARKNLKNIFPKMVIDPLSHYSDRILKNPAMYNAIKKSIA